MSKTTKQYRHNTNSIGRVQCMTDFRKLFYENYVTNFKLFEYSNAHVDRTWSAYRYMYLPLLGGLSRDAPLLELGCGQGLFLRFLKEHGFSNAEGIDISEEQILLARQRDLRVQAADAFVFLKSRKNAFAAIVALDFIEHFTADELLDLVPLIHTALMDQGMVLIRTPNGEGLFPGRIIYGDITHMSIFTPNSIAQLFRQFFFDQIEFYECPPIPCDFRGKLRLLLWKIVRQVANICKKIETGHTQGIWTENLVMRCVKHS